MKKIFVLFSGLLLISCAEKAMPPKEWKMDGEIAALEAKYPGYRKNDLLLDKLSGDFSSKIDSVAKQNAFSDLPLTVLKISKNPHGKGALVQFYTQNDSYEGRHAAARLHFDYLVLMDEARAESLSQDNKYHVSGKNITSIDEKTASMLVKVQYYSASKKVKRDGPYNVDWNAGVYLCELDSISRVKYDPNL